MPPRHFLFKMDKKEKDLENGLVDSRRGPVVDIPGLPRAISPPSTWTGGPRSPVSFVLWDACYHSLPLSSMLCHVFVGHYLLFFIPLYQQCSIFKGSHFTCDINGVSKRQYDTVIIEFHQKHIQSHAKKRHYLGCKVRKCKKEVFLRALFRSLCIVFVFLNKIIS